MTDSVVIKVPQETTTISEIYRRCLEGIFYEDHDWASGPALRLLKQLSDKETADLHAKSLIKKYSAEWLKNYVEENKFTWLNHHSCGGCYSMVGYIFVAHQVLFDPRCGCSSGTGPQPSSFGEIENWLKMQRSDEIRENIIKGFGFR